MKDYLKNYLLKDLFLAGVLLLTGYAWYELLGDSEQHKEKVINESLVDTVTIQSSNTGS